MNCCDLHNQHCEPPSELCCRDCSEALHPDHPLGTRCVLDVASLHARYLDAYGQPGNRWSPDPARWPVEMREAYGRWQP